MAKQKHRPQSVKSSPVMSPAGPTSSNPSLSSYPTPTQLEEIQFFKAEAATIPGDGHPPEPPLVEPPPPGLTIDQAIKDAREARRIFDAARARLEEDRRRVDGLDSSVREQRATLEKEVSRLRDRDKQLQEQEKQLLEQRALLTERENNASAGFVVERRRMVGELEQQVTALQSELAALRTASDDRRVKESAELRSRIDERDAVWRREDEARSRAIDQERREHDERFAREREACRAALQAELTSDRQRAATERSRERAEHEAWIAAEYKALEARRAKLDEGERALRLQKRQLDADREILDENKVALESQIDRRAAARVSELEADLAAMRESRDRAISARAQQAKSLASYHELELRFGGERPEQILPRLHELERERDELAAKLRASPGEAAVSRLAMLEKERSAMLEQQSVLGHQLADVEARLAHKRLASIELESLRAERETHGAQRKLLEAAIRDLQVDVDKYTQKDESRNPMEALISIDRDETWQMPGRTQSPINATLPSLREFARDLRQRIATGIEKRTLHYSDRDVRCFLGGLAMSRMMLLQGISGTGKTSLPLAFAQAVGGERDVVEVQAGWRDRQDLVGYFNAFDRRYYATNFLTALYRAGTPACRDRLCVIVLDEINLSRVEQFFADFLSALELPEEQRRLTLLGEPLPMPPALITEGKHLPIPPNVWFVGTANHDETTTEFADKTYDRAHVMELPRRDLALEGPLIDKQKPRDPISYQGLMREFEAAETARVNEVHRALEWLGAKDGIAGLLDRRFRVGWGNRLERDVKRFVPVVVQAGGTLGEAMDHLLETKVLRKLRDRHDVRATPLDELKSELQTSWVDSESPPERSLRLIERELRAKRDEAEG